MTITIRKPKDGCAWYDDKNGLQYEPEPDVLQFMNYKKDTVVLTEEEWGRFLEACIYPHEPNDALINAMENYIRKYKHAELLKDHIRFKQGEEMSGGPKEPIPYVKTKKLPWYYKILFWIGYKY